MIEQLVVTYKVKQNIFYTQLHQNIFESMILDLYSQSPHLENFRKYIIVYKDHIRKLCFMETYLDVDFVVTVDSQLLTAEVEFCLSSN